MLSEEIISHWTNLRRKSSDIRRKRSKRVFVVIGGEKSPSYGHQTLRRSHHYRKIGPEEMKSAPFPVSSILFAPYFNRKSAPL